MEGFIRQGDVLLVPVGLPTGAKVVRKAKDHDENGIVVAAGEATGHHHRVRSPHARMYRHGARRFITTRATAAKLTHEEHGTLELPANQVFEVRGQREYVAPERSQRVWD